MQKHEQRKLYNAELHASTEIEKYNFVVEQELENTSLKPLYYQVHCSETGC